MATHESAHDQRQTEADATVERLAFLARAGEVLASSLDYEQTLQAVAQLAVPILADLCIVDVVEDGVLRRVATAHASAAKTALLDTLLRNYPVSPDSPQPAARVMRTGRIELLDRITPEVVAAHTRDANHARLIEAIGIRANLALPLVARGATVGVLSLGISESDRSYGPDDVAFAQDLARRAALAIDNARLYRLAQSELAERRRAEDALRMSEMRFRAIMEQSPLSTQILAPDGHTLRVNRAWEALWGVTFAQISDYNILADPQLEARGIAPLLRRAFAGEPVDLPAIRYDPNETIPDRSRYSDPARWVRAFAYPVKDPSGAVREVVLVHEDVTESREREERLRSSEERLQLLADAGSAVGASLDYHATLKGLARLLVPRFADWCAVDLLNEAGVLARVAINHADPARVALALELFERFPPRKSDPSGAWHVLETEPPYWTAEITDDVLRSMAQNEEHLEILRGLNLSSFVRVPLVARGARLGVLTLGHAESGRRYEASDVDLAMDVARRAAAAVDNAQLYEQLRTEDRRKNEFLATLAHELRNPLAPIRTGLALLRTPQEPEAAERTRQIMERQLGHMVRLIDDLLDLSRVTRGTVQLETERVDLWSIVGSAIEASRPLIDAAGIELVVRLPEAPVLLEADRTRMAQVLSNLLNNAAKFTHPGGRVEVHAAEEGQDVAIRVRDTGIGIPPQMLGHIFDLFAQLGDARTRTHSGLGIGLTLVRRLVELHGGQVWAESEGRGHGATFVVKLPRAQQPVVLPEPPLAHAGHGASPEARRVLVVDDNADAAEMLAALLALDGHDVRTASTGPDALEVARDFSPQVAFLDIGLPGMDGYELAAGLRAIPRLATIMLVAVTGWGQDDDRERSKGAGIDHHLTKPVDAAAVRALVTQS